MLVGGNAGRLLFLREGDNKVALESLVTRIKLIKRMFFKPQRSLGRAIGPQLPQAKLRAEVKIRLPNIHCV